MLVEACQKLHGKLFEGFNINARNDRYNIMRSIDAYKIEHQTSSYNDGRSDESCLLPITSTTKAL